MQLLISTLRERVGQMGSATGCLGEHFSRDHLTWMIDTAEAETNLPLDKRIRWLGFVAGARDISVWGPTPTSMSRMESFEDPVLLETQGHSEPILRAGLLEVVDGLIAMADAAGSRVGSQLKFLLGNARSGRCAAEISFRLGYVQAYMTGGGLIAVDAERESTRSIFHRVYAECGFEIPQTRERIIDKESRA